jgi:hypothetical protein
LCFRIWLFDSLNLLTCLWNLNTLDKNAESNSSLRRPQMQRQNATRVPK